MGEELVEFEKLFQRIENSEGFKPTIHQNATLEEFERNYYLQGRLGVGGFSVVKRCQKISTGEEFAVKIVDKKKYRKRNNRLIQEIEVLSKVNHKNCIRLYEAYITNTTVLLVTDLVRGGELLDRILQFGRFQESYACYILKMVLEGVEYLHANGIVHRDLKLENILFIDSSPLACITIADFGLSKIVREDSILSTICGSPQYVAPEILVSGTPVRSYTPQVDMWSLGVLLYIMLCGSPPFDTQYGDSAMFDKIKNGKYLTVGPIWDRVTQQAKDFLSKLLTIDCTKRYTATQALDDDWIQNVSDPNDIDISFLQVRGHNKGSHQVYDSKLAHPEWTFAKLKQKSSVNISVHNEGSHKHQSFHDKSLLSNGSTYAQSHVTSRRSFYFDEQFKGLGNSEIRYSLSNLQKKKMSHRSSSCMSGSDTSHNSSMQEATILSSIENLDTQHPSNHPRKYSKNRKYNRKHSANSQKSFQNEQRASFNSNTSNGQISNHVTFSNQGKVTNGTPFGNVQNGAMSSQEISNLIKSDFKEAKGQDQQTVGHNQIYDHRLSKFLQNLEHQTDYTHNLNKQHSRENKSALTSTSLDSLQCNKSFEYDQVDYSNKSSNNQNSIQSRQNSLREPGHQLNQENLGSLQQQSFEDSKSNNTHFPQKFKNFMEPSFTLLQPQISLRDIVTFQQENQNVNQNKISQDGRRDSTKSHDLPITQQGENITQQIQSQLLSNESLNVSLDDLEISNPQLISINLDKGQEPIQHNENQDQKPDVSGYKYNAPIQNQTQGQEQDKETIQSTSFSFFPAQHQTQYHQQ